jgi:hypothetical protein
MAAALTNGQKAYLAQLAERAFDRNGKWQMADGKVKREAVLKWRHEEVAKACGKLGLRCCSQDDYGYVKAHFLGLLGEEGMAVRAAVKQATNELRVVQWKIVNKCKEYGIPLSTAEGICRRMTRGKGLQEVEEVATLWNVFFKLRYYEPKEQAA